MAIMGSEFGLLDASDDEHDDRPELCTAELAECTCPEFCERDHDTD